MKQQEQMERILENWVRTSQNLATAEQVLPPNSKTAQSLAKEKKQQERVLKSYGFVYRILVEHKEAEWKAYYIFRPKRAKRMRKVHNNWLTKHVSPDWVSTEMKEIELS